MLSKGDDYPIHQTPEPIAFSGTDRNFYDRYFFNSYHPEFDFFFAGALGVYPHLEIMDASFCVVIDGKQHNIRASRHLRGERLDLSVGPISIAIIEPLRTIALRLAPNDSPITADLIFTARHAPIEEPRFTRRIGARAFMDYTRMTQNGAWSGNISVNGVRLALDPGQVLGTRDRSWGVRPVGKSDPQPPVGGNLSQFYWVWTPLNFPTSAVFFHSNDDAEGLPWNRRAVFDPLNTPPREEDRPSWTCRYHPGTRRIAEARLEFPGPDSRTLHYQPTSQHFYMSGLGYTHPEWGHGMDHGPDAMAYDVIDLARINDQDPALMHIQAMTQVTLEHGSGVEKGVGVIEQLFIGPHEPSGFTGLLDGAAS